MKTALRTVLLLSLATSTIFAADAPDPIVGKWKFFTNRTRVFNADGTSINQEGKQDAIWKLIASAPGEPRKYVITYERGKSVDRLMLKNGDSFLEGTNNVRVRVTANRVAETPAGPAPAAAVFPANLRNDTEMALNADWVPKRERTSMELTRSLAFYSLAALDGAERGKEKVPERIIHGLTWLMPLEQAEKLLAPAMVGSQLGTPVSVQNQNFPQRSFYVKTYTGKFQPDPQTGEVFSQAHLLLDAKRRLISVQLTDNHPKLPVGWEVAERPWWKPEPWMATPKDVAKESLPALTGRRGNAGPDGIREPYYDFITSKANASTSQRVEYQIRRGHPGVTCIHMALMKGYPPDCIENVRWYLPAPLARVLLDIAVQNKSTSAPTK